MNTQKIDLAGKRYGRWVVLEQAEPGKGYSTRWLCKCDCGTVKSADGQLLRTGKSQSCGCMSEERRIQIPNSIMNDDERLRAIYISIRSACEQPKDPKYHKFGGKGITVCDEWKRSFQAFAEWSKKNGYTSGAFLLRYDVNQGYTPYNSKWAHSSNEGNGRKGSIMLTANGETHSIAEWTRITGLNRSSIEERLLRGATPEEAVNPERKPRGRKPKPKN